MKLLRYFDFKLLGILAAFQLVYYIVRVSQNVYSRKFIEYFNPRIGIWNPRSDGLRRR